VAVAVAVANAIDDVTITINLHGQAPEAVWETAMTCCRELHLN
jgi:hypothetical protein